MKKNIDYSKLAVEDILQDLRSDREKGLSGEEAKRRVSEYGYNEIPEREESVKTGTLTQNMMTVSDPVPFGDTGISELMLCALLASREENADPIEVPLFDYVRKSGGMDNPGMYRQISFVPFDPVSKRTEAVVTDGKETFTVTKGTPHVILDLCGKGSGEQQITDKVEEFAEKGFRTLAVALKREGEEKFAFMGLVPLFAATFITEIIGTLFAVYGIFLNPIGWKYALIIWGYALSWFVINDFIKIWTFKVLQREKVVI